MSEGSWTPNVMSAFSKMAQGPVSIRIAEVGEDNVFTRDGSYPSSSVVSTIGQENDPFKKIEEWCRVPATHCLGGGQTAN